MAEHCMAAGTRLRQRVHPRLGAIERLRGNLHLPVSGLHFCVGHAQLHSIYATTKQGKFSCTGL